MKYVNISTVWRVFCFVLIGWGLSRTALKAQDLLPNTLREGAQISILVIEPSPEAVYTLYGHAALRVTDPNEGLDIVFNYGLFQFDDSFIYKFIKGQTDYFAAPEHTSYFIQGYTERGSQVRELQLRFPPEVKQLLWQKVLRSIEPKYREYRYNFFRDNCSTRPVQLILNAAQEATRWRLELPSLHEQGRSWRSEINALERAYPWVVLGTDLALGAPADGLVNNQEATFLPHNIAPFLAHGSWFNLYNQEREPFLVGEHVYEATAGTCILRQPPGLVSYLIHPYTLFGAFLLLTLLVTFVFPVGYKALELVVLVGVAGASFVLFYITVLSEHPSVWPNYNLLVLHPLHMLRPLLIGRWARRWVLYYHFANFALQAMFMVGAYFLPQAFNLSIYMLSATLLVLSLGHLIEAKRGAWSNI